LARLIRERPVFVNVAGRRKPASLKGRNWDEYICFCGVFNGMGALAAPREPTDMSEP
jgi:hypothetical protein